VAYNVWIRPEAHAARRKLPGHLRQRVARLIDELEVEPRPPRSRALVRGPDATADGWEIRRVRLDEWRIVYGLNEDRRQVAVLGIRRRPPYGYEDLETLLTDL
jgi:mRNA-degrading endonuclease RelE of RelBE toxin-antitoxin system